MDRIIHKWYSSNLNKEMHLLGYGYYGYALLLFPASEYDYTGYENSLTIDSISDFINNGTLKAYSIDSILSDSWLNKSISIEKKAILQQNYNKYIEEEVIPFINKECGENVPVVACGVSVGAYLAVNTFFRRPDLFAGVIGMSGNYDLKKYTDGYFDENCYFNSPVDFLPKLNDEKILEQLNNKNIIIASGQGSNEDPSSSILLSQILNAKNINHWLDIWGFDMNHEWPTWQKMLPYFLNNINV